MAFEKGNKQGGRTKGAVNKVTQSARETVLRDFRRSKRAFIRSVRESASGVT